MEVICNIPGTSHFSFLLRLIPCPFDYRSSCQDLEITFLEEESSEKKLFVKKVRLQANDMKVAPGILLLLIGEWESIRSVQERIYEK